MTMPMTQKKNFMQNILCNYYPELFLVQTITIKISLQTFFMTLFFWPSMIRMKFATIDKSIIIKTLGRLQEKDSNEFGQALINFFQK